MKILTARLAALAGVLSATATLAVAQTANPFEIARVNPEGGAKSVTVPLESAGQTRTVRIENPAPITQAHLSRASVAKEKVKVTSSEKPETKEVSVIRINLNAAGSKALVDLTTGWEGKLLAVVVDGKAIATPAVKSVIKGGELTISGNFTPDQAKALAGKIQEAAGKK